MRKIDDLLETTQDKWNPPKKTADNFVLIQFSTKTTKTLNAGQVEEKETSTYKVKVMWRQGETSQFAFSDTVDMSETEREDIAAKLARLFPSGRTAPTATLKDCTVIRHFLLYHNRFRAIHITSLPTVSQQDPCHSHYVTSYCITTGSVPFTLRHFLNNN